MATPREKIEAFNQANPPAEAPHLDTAKVLHGYHIADPYGLLMVTNMNGTPEWVAAQQARTDAFFAEMKEPDVEENSAEGEHLPEPPAPCSLMTRHVERGEKNFALVYDSGTLQKRLGMWTTASDAITLVDPLKIDPTGHTAISEFFPSPDGNYVAYFTSHAASNNSSLYVYDVQKQKILPPVQLDIDFYMDELLWDDDSKGFRYSHDQTNVSHYSVEEEKLQAVFSSSSLGSQITRIYDTRNENGQRSIHDFITLQAEYVGADNGVYYRHRLDLEDAYTELFNDKEHYLIPIAEVDGKLFARTNHGAAMGRLVTVDLKNPAPEHWQTIIPERGRDKLLDVTLHNGQMLVTYLHDAAHQFGVYALDGTHLHDAPLPEQVACKTSIIPNEKLVDMSYRGFAYEGGDFSYNPETNEASDLREYWPEKSGDYIVERAYATSRDGTQVPMTIVRHKDVKLDGTAATLITGYGGFNTLKLPNTDDFQKEWLDKGGIFVQTNLRGGGEFDHEWYDQGRRHNKQNTFDDFAVCAKYLIEKGYTCPERLASKGHSNGGLLTLATGLQHPELYGAVIADVPVTDMLASVWDNDYGNPRESVEDFECVMEYSPLHNIKKGVKYPPMLVMTADHDEVVEPWHSYKFVATMQEKSPETLCLLHVTETAGHGGGNQQKNAEKNSCMIAFCEAALGPINQERYQAMQDAQWTSRVEGQATASTQR